MEDHEHRFICELQANLEHLLGRPSKPRERRMVIEAVKAAGFTIKGRGVDAKVDMPMSRHEAFMAAVQQGITNARNA